MTKEEFLKVVESLLSNDTVVNCVSTVPQYGLIVVNDGKYVENFAFNLPKQSTQSEKLNNGKFVETYAFNLPKQSTQSEKHMKKFYSANEIVEALDTSRSLHDVLTKLGLDYDVPSYYEFDPEALDLTHTLSGITYTYNLENESIVISSPVGEIPMDAVSFFKDIENRIEANDFLPKPKTE